MSATILADCELFDGAVHHAGERRHILVEDGRIREVSDRPLASASARTVRLDGRFVMPGLIDAHFHAYGTSLDIASIDRTPPSLRALEARALLEASLQRGFTTVRDAGGADVGLVVATRRGLIRGPRIFHAGLAISQTGGHGDMRHPEQHDICACAFCGSMSIVADGPDEVRKAVREQLRRGATQIKLFVSGGVLSPADPLWMDQLTDEEIGAAVHEAGTRRTYVMAHAHTAQAAMRCIANGVRSIEHATMLDAPTARAVADSGAFAVPTLAIIDAVRELGPQLGLSSAMVAKAAEVSGHALASLDHLTQAGARIGFGTDLLGVTQPRQSCEFRLRREVCAPLDILRSATSVNADLLNMAGELGTVAPEAVADLIVIDGSPAADVTLLEDHARIVAVMKDGEFLRFSL